MSVLEWWPLGTVLAAGLTALARPTERAKAMNDEGEHGPADRGECGTCPLTALPVGQPACLVCIGAGRRLKRRLASLGLTPGVELTVLQNQGGPLLIAVRDSRLALGRGMARKLDVDPVSRAGRVPSADGLQ